jgi:hypothetical protein
MTKWYYRDESGEKVGPITPNTLKALATQGVITPETVIENEGGKSARADSIKGLTPPQESFLPTKTSTLTPAPAVLGLNDS